MYKTFLMKQLSVPLLYWLSDVWELVTEAWAQLLNCQTEIWIRGGKK